MMLVNCLKSGWECAGIKLFTEIGKPIGIFLKSPDHARILGLPQSASNDDFKNA